jgi:hypothetical protein
MDNKKFRLELTSFALHILAMIFMVFDHIWGVFATNGYLWMTCIGRLTYPIFAFMIVEGYFKTKNLKKYVLRLLVFALISEIPFNLVMSSSWFSPLHQNVLWTFLIGILLIFLNEKARAKKLWIRALVLVGTVLLGTLLGIVSFVDYGHGGVLIILAFYVFRGRKWWCLVGQIVSLLYISFEVISGQFIPITLFGNTFELIIQSFCVLTLVPIWLYRGKQGPYNKAIRYLYYGFYPAHLLILWLIRMWIL